MAGLFLIFILFAQETTLQANTSLQIDASLAFNGYVSDRKFTELRITAVNKNGGTLAVETSGANPDVSLSLELMPGEPTVMSVPLGIDFRKGRLMVHARFNQGEPESIPLNFVPRPLPRFALVGELAVRLLSHIEGTESLGAMALPRIAHAYSQVSSLAIDGSALALLDDAQLRSLLERVGACEKTLLINASQAVQHIFANRAACEGRFLQTATGDANVAVVFENLIRLPASSPPSDTTLRQLLTSSVADPFKLSRIVIFLTLYLFTLLVLIIRAPTPLAAWGLSLVSAMLALLVWPSGTSRAFVAWAEMTSKDHVAHYAALERYATSRHGNYLLAENGFGGYPTGISANHYTLTWGQSANDRNLQWNAAPFERLYRSSRGSFAVDTTLHSNTHNGLVSVCNSGSAFSRPAFLYWQGDIYKIPPLSPGVAWSSGNHTATSGLDLPELQLLRARSYPGQATLLQALPAADGDRNLYAWLLQRESIGKGQSLCAT